MSFEADGLLRKMNSLEIGILIEFWSSVLRRVNETSSLLQSPQLDLNNAIPLLHSLVDFFNSQRNHFSQFEDLGQKKSGHSDYKIQRKRKRSIRLTQFEGSAVETSLPPAEMFRSNVFLPIIDNFVSRLEKRIDAYKPIVRLFGFLHNLTRLSKECLLQAATELIDAYPNGLERELKDEIVQFAYPLSHRRTSELFLILLLVLSYRCSNWFPRRESGNCSQTWTLC